MDDNPPPDFSPEPGRPADPAPDGPPSDPAAELRQRVTDLEQELARTRAQRDALKADVNSLMEAAFPFEPPTEAELYDMMHGPRGQPILEIIEEYERRLKAGGG